MFYLTPKSVGGMYGSAPRDPLALQGRQIFDRARASARLTSLVFVLIYYSAQMLMDTEFTRAMP
jgi:hypothetical protein